MTQNNYFNKYESTLSYKRAVYLIIKPFEAFWQLGLGGNRRNWSTSKSEPFVLNFGLALKAKNSKMKGYWHR